MQGEPAYLQRLSAEGVVHDTRVHGLKHAQQSTSILAIAWVVTYGWHNRSDRLFQTLLIAQTANRS